MADITERRARLGLVQTSGVDSTMQTMLAEAQRTNAELHGVLVEMGQTVRAYAKDIQSYIKDDEREDTSREDAHRAEVAALNAQLMKATADCARCEGELTALRQAYADIKAMCDSMMKEDAAEEETAPKIVRFDVHSDGVRKSLHPVYEGADE